MEDLQYQDLRVSIAATRQEMDESAAALFASAAAQAVAAHGSIAIVLAAANSQLGFMDAVGRRNDIPWSSITVLHMDEYIGMSEDHPASFRRWMRSNVIEPFAPRAFEGIRGDAGSIESEVQRYESILRELHPTICVMGIGENGHLAFNDPPADFETSRLVKVVEIDEMSRKQQVGEGHFESVADVPREAITLTVPALTAPQTVIVVAPETRKASAVRTALEGPVTPHLPASILQVQAHAHLFLDAESAAQLTRPTP